MKKRFFKYKEKYLNESKDKAVKKLAKEKIKEEKKKQSLAAEK